MDYESQVMEIVNQIKNGESRDLKLYDELAPVYHFLYGKEYDYDGQADIAENFAPRQVSKIIDGGCGTGGLTGILGKRFPEADVIGVDLNHSMLEIAREHMNQENVEFKDMDILKIREEMEVFTFFGTTPHLEEGELQKLFRKIREMLSENGVLVLDYKSPKVKKHEDGYYQTWSRETENFKIKNPITTIYTDEGPHYIFSFEFTEKATDKKFYTGDVMKIFLYEEEEMREMLREAGFSEINSINEGDQSGILAAKK